MSDEIPLYRLRDQAKVVGDCDGYFEPSPNQYQDALHPGKTAQDRMPVEKRPRVIAARKRAERMKDA